MVFNGLPSRCWVSPDGEVYPLPLLDCQDVYADWSSNNESKINPSGDLPLDFINAGWLMVHWQKIICFKGAEDSAIKLAHDHGVSGKWYTITVLMLDGMDWVGSVQSGSRSSRLNWWKVGH
jgi:hypothetical protein